MNLDSEFDEGNSDVDEGPEPELYYANVSEFVTDRLSVQFQRKIDLSGRTHTFEWCSKWWLHQEAVSRLTSLWRAWESLRLEPGTGMAVWWRDYADPTMRVLFDPNGPFEGCTPDCHQPKVIPLPLAPPPDGLFDEE